MNLTGAAVHEPDLLPVLDSGGVGGEQPQVPAVNPALQGRPCHRTFRLHPNRGRETLPGLPWYTSIIFKPIKELILCSFSCVKWNTFHAGPSALEKRTHFLKISFRNVGNFRNEVNILHFTS
jgi:hypothetical protein